MFWIILSVLLWGFLHSLFASLPVKALFLRLLGESLRPYYRLAYNLLSVFSLLPVVVLVLLLPDHTLYIVPLPWSILMAIGEILALAILIVAFRQTNVWEFLGLQHLVSPTRSLSPEASLETSQGRLVTSGAYRYVRHPLYSAGLAFIWLFPFMTDNLLVINFALTFYVVMGAYFEERKLRNEFGQEYVEYATKTPMFIPFLKWNKLPR